MSALVLIGRRRNYTFDHSQLQHYPESLFTNLAQTSGGSQGSCTADKGLLGILRILRSERGSSSSSSSSSSSVHVEADSTVQIRLRDMPNSPLVKHEWAADAADSIYREHRISADIVASLVKDVKGRSMDHFKQTFVDLVDVLSYLGFPGHISKFLPNIAAIPLSQTKVLAFCFAFQDLQHVYQVTKSAEQTVSTVLNYCPFSTEPADPVSGNPQPVQNLNEDANAAAEGANTDSKPLVNEHAILSSNWHRLTVFAFASDEQDIHAPLKVYVATGQALKKLADAYEQHIKSLNLANATILPQLPTSEITLYDPWEAAGLKFAEVLGSCRLGPERGVAEMSLKQWVGQLAEGHIKKAFESRIQTHAEHALLSLHVVKVGLMKRRGAGPAQTEKGQLTLWVLCY